MRFRRSIKIAPGIKLNLSKKGVSTTIGPKGFSINTSSRGTFLNTGIPGTGLSSRRKISNSGTKLKYSSRSISKSKIFSDADVWAKKKSKYIFSILLIVAGFIFMFIQIIFSVFLLLGGLILISVWMFSKAGKSTFQIRKARTVYNYGYLNAAIDHLERANVLYPNPFLPGYIISLAMTNKRFEAALKYLNEMDDRDSTSVFERAECNFELGHFSEATL